MLHAGQTLPTGEKRKEKKRKEKKRNEKNRTEQNRTEQNRTEQKRKEKKRKEKKKKEKTTPFGVNLMNSQVLYRAAQETMIGGEFTHTQVDAGVGCCHSRFPSSSAI